MNKKILSVAIASVLAAGAGAAYFVYDYNEKRLAIAEAEKEALTTQALAQEQEKELIAQRLAALNAELQDKEARLIEAEQAKLQQQASIAQEQAAVATTNAQQAVTQDAQVSTQAEVSKISVDKAVVETKPGVLFEVFALDAINRQRSSINRYEVTPGARIAYIESESGKLDLVKERKKPETGSFFFEEKSSLLASNRSMPSFNAYLQTKSAGDLILSFNSKSHQCTFYKFDQLIHANYDEQRKQYKMSVEASNDIKVSCVSEANAYYYNDQQAQVSFKLVSESSDALVYPVPKIGGSTVFGLADLPEDMRSRFDKGALVYRSEIKDFTFNNGVFHNQTEAFFSDENYEMNKAKVETNAATLTNNSAKDGMKLIEFGIAANAPFSIILANANISETAKLAIKEGGKWKTASSENSSFSTENLPVSATVNVNKAGVYPVRIAISAYANRDFIGQRLYIMRDGDSLPRLLTNDDILILADKAKKAKSNPLNNADMM